MAGLSDGRSKIEETDMEKKNGAILVVMAVAAVAAAVLAATGCQDNLGIKDYVKQQVATANTHLRLTEVASSTDVAEGGTAAWPDTIFTETLPRSFRLTNTGPDVVTLVGANPVAITGGSGQAAYGGIVQPAQLVLQPGDSTTFSVSFTPPLPDADYLCDMVVNSDDSTNPAFKFSGRGHSIQWHGSKAITPPSGAIRYDYPKIAIVDSTIYVAYSKYNSDVAGDRGIGLRYSTNGGSTWIDLGLVVACEHLTGFSFAASRYYLHLFYYDTGTTPESQVYKVSSAPPSTVDFQSVGSGTFYFRSYYSTINNDAIALANGQVYVAVFDYGTATLSLAVRSGEAVQYNGNPGFYGSVYPITDGSIHTGGRRASLKVDANNAYMTYTDGSNLRAVVVPLSTISDSSTYSYRLVAADPNGYYRELNSLIIDSGRAYAFWEGASDHIVRSASSTDLSLASWSDPVALAGEDTQFSPMLGFIRADGILYALYERNEDRAYSIRLSRSGDNGATWTSESVDGPIADAGNYGCSMTRSGSDFYIVYATGSGHANGYSVTIKKSLDAGATW